MDQGAKLINKRFLFLCLILLFVLFGCESEREAGMHPIQKHCKLLHKEMIPSSFLSNEIQAPISIEKGQFNSVNGWLNNDSIIYMTNVEFGTNVYTYNIYSGESRLIFESEAPVSTVMASPSGNHMLIHSSPNSYEGIITVVDANGAEVLQERLSAFEFNFEWNPYDEGKILISSFTEDWNYSIHLLNIKEKTFDNINNKEPFANWISKDEIVYLNWGQNNNSLFAPLVKRSIINSDEKRIMDNIYYVKAIKDLLMTVTVNSNNGSEALYTFFSNGLQELSSFSAPHLTRYADWLVPFFDFDSNHHFYVFEPLYSTDADQYDKGFQLLAFNIKNGNKKVIMENLKNEPLSCSPNGKLCLYGFYYDKLINMETKEIIPLVSGL